MITWEDKPQCFKHPPPLIPFYRFYLWPWCRVAQNIPSLSWDQWLEPCPHPNFLLSPSLLACGAVRETENALMFYKHCSAISKTPKYCTVSALVLSQIQTHDSITFYEESSFHLRQNPLKGTMLSGKKKMPWWFASTL